MVAVSDLLRPRSVAVVGANDDRDTFGGRIWHYLGEYSDIERMAVNARPGAFKDTTVASSLSELAHRPDLVVLATPAKTILGLVADAASVGAKAALVFSQVPPEVRGKLRQLVDDAGLTLLGPGSLGLINATDGVILSSSVSLERAPRSGPLALVAQSGALMGVLHASAGEQGIGLGLCVATGSQLQVRVEHLLAALGTDGEYLAVGAHLEDIDVDLFVDAAKSIVGTGRLEGWPHIAWQCRSRRALWRAGGRRPRLSVTRARSWRRRCQPPGRALGMHARGDACGKKLVLCNRVRRLGRDSW